ncbi:MAG: DNA polymerase IV [Clostridia bacterium]|nr:DNA polymerase IV [Clostridia bacterium]
MERQIMHIDVNNAFLSWYAIWRLKNGEREDIREIPAIIGGDETKRAGIVLAKSNLAKKFGIVTGEPIYQARKKCPNIKVFQGDYKVYKDYSNKLYNLLLEYTDKIERFSIDECFLDMTEYLMNSTLQEKANEIRKRVNEELGFTVNIGLSSNKLLAKMASDFEKPNKIHTLYPNEIENKMWSLPVGELFMLGRKSVPKLNNLHIKTIGDLAKFDLNKLIKIFGKHGKLMWEYANGIDLSEVIYKYEPPKSISNSTTLAKDIEGLDKLNEILLTLAEFVSYRLRRYNMVGKVVNVGLRTNEFKDFSHQKKLDTTTSNTKDIYLKAKELLKEMYKGESIRLVSLKVDNLCDKCQTQISLFDDEETKKQEKLDETLDKLKEKFGYTSITRAGKLGSEKQIKLK